MSSRRQFLEWHGKQWRVQKKVPAKLRQIIGKSKLVFPLHTDSLVTADRKKWDVLRIFNETLEKAEAELSRRQGAADPLISEALVYRQELSRAVLHPLESAQYDQDGDVLEDGPSFIREFIGDRTQELIDTHGVVRASAFYGVATGTATPIMLLVDEWLAERSMKPRQRIDYRRAVAKFSAWLPSNNLPASVEEVSRKIAGHYVSKAFVGKGVHARTTNKDISCLSSYWKWLEGKGHVEENVWKGQSVREHHTMPSLHVTSSRNSWTFG